MTTVRDMDLCERNHGGFKAELVAGLCSNSSVRQPHSTHTRQTTKRAIALFKYIFGYLLRQAFVSHVKSSCQRCVIPTSHSEHSCLRRMQDQDLMQAQFYFHLHTIDKSSLVYLFNKCLEQEDLQLVPVCLCVLHYKCLTIWRPLMRKQFLSLKLPSGIGKRVIDAFFAVAQEWENGKRPIHALKQTCSNC